LYANFLQEFEEIDEEFEEAGNRGKSGRNRGHPQFADEIEEIEDTHNSPELARSGMIPTPYLSFFLQMPTV
jgi:hypothetical protein